MIKKIESQDVLNKSILTKLLNAVWIGSRRGQKVAVVRIFEERIESPLLNLPSLKRLEDASRQAVIVVSGIMLKQRGPHAQVGMIFSWNQEQKGTSNAGPGIRGLVLRVSSINCMKPEIVSEINSLNKKLRRRRKE
ncbi:MAG: hypothetical protein WAX44_00725 [Minisyncoccia bacterium]